MHNSPAQFNQPCSLSITLSMIKPAFQDWDLHKNLRQSTFQSFPNGRNLPPKWTARVARNKWNHPRCSSRTLQAEATFSQRVWLRVFPRAQTRAIETAVVVVVVVVRRLQSRCCRNVATHGFRLHSSVRGEVPRLISPLGYFRRVTSRELVCLARGQLFRRTINHIHTHATQLARGQPRGEL